MSGITIKTEVTISSDDAEVIKKLRRKFGAKKTTAMLAEQMRLSIHRNWTSQSACEVKTSVRVLKVPWERLELSRPVWAQALNLLRMPIPPPRQFNFNRPHYTDIARSVKIDTHSNLPKPRNIRSGVSGNSLNQTPVARCKASVTAGA